MTLFDFSKTTKIKQWHILDDNVMGGRSKGKFRVSNNGYGEFYGKISLDNNGGFSSLRYTFDTIDSSRYKIFIVSLKGDGRPYQFRVKNNRHNRFSYIYVFETSGEWETIEIPFDKMHPSFRGKRLNASNFDGLQMEEVAILIGNKKAEDFKIRINKISLK